MIVSVCVSGITPPKPAGSNERAKALLVKAHALADAYNWMDAMPLFRQAEDGFRLSGNRSAQTEAHIGSLRVDLHLPISARAVELSDLLTNNQDLRRDKQLRLFALIVLGDLDGETDWVAARRDWTQVRELAGQMGISKWIYRADGQIGFTYFYQGDFGTCQRMVAAALVQATEAQDVGAEIFFLSTTGNGYANIRMFHDSEIYARRAIDLSAAFPRAGYPRIALSVLIDSLVGSGQIKEANKTLDQHCSQLPFGQCLEARALISRAEGNTARAIEQYQQAIPQAVAVGENRAAADWETGLADVYLSSGDLASAVKLEKAAVASLKASGSIALLPEAMGLLADILVREGQFKEADGIFDEAMTIQDAMLGKANTIQSKTAVITKSNSLYARHFALAADHFNNLAEAYRIIEQARGRVLTDLLVYGGVTSPASIATEREISKLQLNLMSYRTPAEAAHIRDSIFVAQQSRAVNAGITILSAKANKPIEATTVRSALKPSEAILEYVVAEPSSYCLFLTQTDAGIVRLAGKNQIEHLVSKYREAVKAKLPANEEAAELYGLLLKPISLVQNTNHLVIVPDGSLHLLPFDALVDEHGKYVVQSKNVSYSPSSSTLYLLRTRHPRLARPAAMLAVGGVPYSTTDMPARAVALGYSTAPVGDLPSSRDEAVDLAKVFPDPENKTLTDGATTETAFKTASNAHAFRLIHLAVHAFASDEPDRAALMMLSDPHGRDDGFLQASEIVQMRINADLVMLSACDTAVGPIQGEEGISTLSNAFLIAGARTVVSTLWPVADVPSQFLVKHFYQNMARPNQEPSDAMADAKREMLTAFGSKNLPLYWAGFVVQGSDLSPN